METGSYLELALTNYSWFVANRLAELLVSSGLIYLPILWIAYRNWSETVRSQEAKAAAPVSLRRMEQDVAIVFMTLIFAFLPAVPIAVSDITYRPLGATAGQTVTASDPDLPYTGSASLQQIKLPVLWWSVHQLASGFTKVFTLAVNSFGDTSHIRAITLTLDYAKVDDPRIRAELSQFDRDCYLRAVAKYENDHSARDLPTWRGAEVFFAAGYYGTMEARTQVSSWSNNYSWAADDYGPNCAEWWRDPTNGLVVRIYNNLSEAWKEGPAHYDMEGGYLSAPAGSEDMQDVVKRYLLTEPPPNDNPDGSEKPGSLAAIPGFFGTLFAYPAIRTGMYVVQIGLPMVQAIVLACIYIAVPLLTPFAALRPGLLLALATAIFAVKFMTGLWALAWFIDARLIDFMYPDDRIFAGSGTSADLVLGIITALSYIGLPVIWLWLISRVAGTATQGVDSMFAYSAGSLQSAGASTVSAPIGVAKSLITKKSGKSGKSGDD